MVVSDLPDSSSMRVGNWRYENVAQREIEWHGGDEGGEEGEEDEEERHGLDHCEVVNVVKLCKDVFVRMRWYEERVFVGASGVLLARSYIR